uniref:Uncharacterized protein n=1 Tax=Neobodo designis TaxID=312471 RepID=A0A7S1Q2E6_NEODS|mmetsp:Transcript_29991/g.92526  ORF Transcript_29991/g.92526 Transcript_29991/m.92526 type:complete len:261 (+) Transcript_29991:44-826(+)
MPTPAKPRLTPRPPSPTGSVTSVRTARSHFDDPDVTIDEVREYVDRPHHSWGSALKEMARIETQAQLAKDRRRRLDDMSETGSCVSGVSAYTAKSNVTIRSSVSAPARPAKGRMAMLPLGARATSAHGRDGAPASPTGSVQSGFSVSGSTVAASSVAGGSTRRHTRGGVGAGGGGSVAARAAGPAGGRSGPRRRSESGESGVPDLAPTAMGLNTSPAPPAAASGGKKFAFAGGASAASVVAGDSAPKGGFVPKFKPRTQK